MRILLGLSGGLDSAYSAKLLLDKGYEVEGAVLIMHGCTELDDCRAVAESLSIPLHVIDCRDAFSRSVEQNLIDEYLAGRTPNPCIICNSEIKFKYLYEYAKANGFDKIATGHYARIEKEGGVYSVNMARDTKKDQSYMLWRLPQEILSSLVLPLAERKKEEIRRDALENSLPSASKSESQEICFIPDGDYASFIEQRRGKCPEGYFINNVGKILGTHKGIIRYTVGQRKGLGIALGERMFVSSINARDNTVTLSREDETRDSLFVEGIIFSSVPPMQEGETREYSVKLRYLQAPVKASLTYLGDGRGRVALSEPVRAVTPGQSAVFYEGNRLALGAFISNFN